MNVLTLLSLLHTFPQNDQEIGFNSGIISIMKQMENLSGVDRPEILKLKDAVGSVGVFNMLTERNISDIIDCKTNGTKLMGVKVFKEATGYGLKEAKDVMDDFYAR